MNRWLRLAFCSVLFICLFPGLAVAESAPAQPQALASTLTLAETFGVGHPDQIVFFENVGRIKWHSGVLTEAGGGEGAYQIVSDGRVAVRTDLPANSTKSWNIDTARPAKVAGVDIAESDSGYELSNGLVAIRVPKVPADIGKTPAPIQGVRYRDGQWDGTGPNFMDRPAKSMQVEVLDQGPLVARIKVSYVFGSAGVHSARPELPDIPAGDKPYSVVIEMQAGQPSILFEEDCETDVSYGVDFGGAALSPDRAQYRGHHGTSIAAGMDPDGSVYSYANNVRHDALVKLDYTTPAKERWSHTTYPFMAQWDPWAVNTGFYWELYDSSPTGSDNLLGIFAGPASHLVNPGLSGVSFDTRTEAGKPVFSLHVRFERLMPTQRYSDHMHFGWGLFLGKKSTDLKPQMDVQGINLQMNIHSGFNLSKIAKMPADYPDPEGGYGNLYAPAKAWQGLASAIKAEHDKGGNALFQAQYQLNPYLKPILTYWADPTPAAAEQAAGDIDKFANHYLDTLVNGQGIFEHTTHYFMGAAGMSSYVTWMDMLLASGQLSPATKLKVKQAAALFGSALWDNDVAPMQPNSGMNLGPANMSAMWDGTRYTYALFLSNHPHFSGRVDAVRKDALGLLRNFVNDSGAVTAGAHYSEATMVPILNLLQQLQMRGVVDAFATEPVMKRYPEWEMQLSTPPEPRFGGLRKMIAVGDGSTEQNPRLGQLATGLAPGRPALSARVMGMWKAMGSPQDNFYGPSILKVDPSLPAVSPKLGDDHFEGWMSILRSAYDNDDESAAWLINGDWYFDHRHNDNGEVILYALGAPLSLDFGCMYYPRAAGGLLHSIALPETALGRAWDADNVPLDAVSTNRSTWWHTAAGPLISLPGSACTSAAFTPESGKADEHWQRTMLLLRDDAAHPIIVIDDDFSGKDLAGKPVISTLNLMALGPVDTPAGAVTPVERTHPPVAATTSPDQLPSSGTPFPLAAGLNRFGFTGQWLIDWDLYTDAAAPMQAEIGNWGESWTPATEVNEFRKSQKREFSERQDILRVRGQDHIRTVILPHRKGETAARPTVVKQGDDIVVRAALSTTTIGPEFYSREAGKNLTLTTFSAAPADSFGIHIEGGAAEVGLGGKVGTLTMSGAAGERMVTLPKGWTVEGKKAGTGGWHLPYAGGALVEMKLILQ